MKKDLKKERKKVIRKATAKELKTVIKEGPRKNPESEVGKIGDFLVKMNELSSQEVEQVLRLQKKSPLKCFGEIAMAKGFIYDEATKKYLASKGFI